MNNIHLGELIEVSDDFVFDVVSRSKLTYLIRSSSSPVVTGSWMVLGREELAWSRGCLRKNESIDVVAGSCVLHFSMFLR